MLLTNLNLQDDTFKNIKSTCTCSILMAFLYITVFIIPETDPISKFILL